MKSEEVMDLLEWTGAIMKGHFKVTSGRHSDTYIEKFRLLENPIALDKESAEDLQLHAKQEMTFLAKLLGPLYTKKYQQKVIE